MSANNFEVRICTRDQEIAFIDNFQIHPNEITFLFGESGIGKSLVSKAIYGLLDTNEFELEVNGMPYAHHLADPWTAQIKRSGFFVFQEPSSHLNPLLRLSEQINEGSLAQSHAERETFQHLWHSTNEDALWQILNVYPKPFRPSGGEKQRVLLAMAFKKISLLSKTTHDGSPTCFIFDEPTGSLDDDYRNAFMKLVFEKYVARPFTTMIITHDYSMISQIAKNHAALMPRIHFKEIFRRESNTRRIAMRDFNANDYLKWVGAMTGGVEKGHREEVVLEVGANYRIHGRASSIFVDREHTQSTNLKIHKGEIVYLKAPSGAGKTSLAKAVMGLHDAEELNMILCGKPMTERTPKEVWHRKIWGKKAGMVFQHADEALNLHASVKDAFKGLRVGKRKVTQELTDLFGSEYSSSFLSRRIARLSGGQKQRLNLLRTLILNTDLIILDEPLNGLDFESVKKVLAMLKKKREQGCAILIIAHNEEIFSRFIGEGHTCYLG